MKNIQNILLTEKYRPQSLDDLITPQRVGDKLSKGGLSTFIITR